MKEYNSARETYGYLQNLNSDALHIGFNVEPDMLVQIKHFRNTGRFKSTSAALRELVRRGLRAQV